MSDLLINKVPVDKTSTIVTSKPKCDNIEFKCGDTISSMCPLPMRHFIGPNKYDLTGRKVGRFIVMGLALYKSKSATNNGNRWVVRCSCGRYQMLSGRAIKKGSNDNACVVCRKTISLSKKVT